MQNHGLVTKFEHLTTSLADLPYRSIHLGEVFEKKSSRWVSVVRAPKLSMCTSKKITVSVCVC